MNEYTKHGLTIPYQVGYERLFDDAATGRTFLIFDKGEMRTMRAVDVGLVIDPPALGSQITGEPE